ncbi:MAG: hypothetical protein ACRDJ0_08065 [Actinomycetota bacterium]
MSDFGAYSSDMGWLKKLGDEELDQVLAGSYEGEDPALDDLAVFARDTQAALSGVPGEATRRAHLAAMTEVAQKLEGAPVAAGTPVAEPSRIRRWKLVLTQLLATLAAKVAVTGVALAAATGGLAAAGALPDPAQDALANAAAKVGFELPAGDEGDETTETKELPEATDGSPAQAVLDVIRNWEGDRGCEFGHAVAEAAGGNPGPCPDEGEEGTEENGDKGKPEGTPSGKPDGAGKPEGTPSTKSEGAGEGTGKPEGTPSGKPDGAGKSEATPGGQDEGGRPDGAGAPDSIPGG